MRTGSLLRCLFTLALLPAAPAAAEFEGTLFSTPQERAYLDYLREEFLASQQEQGFNIIEETLPEIPQDAETAPEPRVFTLGGIAAGRDGTHTIWLNDKALSTNELESGITLATENGVTGLRFTTDAGTRFLKPGQTIELNSGSVSEGMHRAPGQPEQIAVAETATEEAGTEAAAPEAEIETATAPETPANSFEPITINTLEQLQEVLEAVQNRETDEQ